MKHPSPRSCMYVRALSLNLPPSGSSKQPLLSYCSCSPLPPPFHHRLPPLSGRARTSFFSSKSAPHLTGSSSKARHSRGAEPTSASAPSASESASSLDLHPFAPGVHRNIRRSRRSSRCSSRSNSSSCRRRHRRRHHHHAAPLSLFTHLSLVSVFCYSCSYSIWCSYS